MAKRRKDTGYRVAVSGARRLVSLLLLTLVLIIIFFLGRMAYRFGYSVFHQEAMSKPLGENITVTIPAGADAKEIGGILRNAGLISDVTLFRVQERLSAYHNDLKTDFEGGTFRLNTSQTTDELLAVIVGETSEVQEVAEPQVETDVRDPNAEDKLIDDVTNDSNSEAADPNAEDRLIQEVTNDSRDENSESGESGEEGGNGEDSTAEPEADSEG